MINYHIELRKHDNNDKYEVVDKCIIKEYENGHALIDASDELIKKHNFKVIDEGMMASADVTTRDLYVLCEETKSEVYYSLEIVDKVEYVDEENDSKCLYLDKKTYFELLEDNEILRELHNKIATEKDTLKQFKYFLELETVIKEMFGCERIIYTK